MPTHHFNKTEKAILRIAAYRLAAHKAFMDYSIARRCFAVEPEHFLEEWASRFVPGMESDENKAFHREFMHLLTNKIGR